MQTDKGDTALVFKGLTSRLGGGGVRVSQERVRGAREERQGQHLEEGRSEGHPLEEVVFAPDSDKQVGRRNGRNAVLCTGGQEVRTCSEGCVCTAGALGPAGGRP